MNENEISKIIIDTAYEVYNELGTGFLESVYERILAELLREKGLIAECQVPMPIIFREKKYELGFRADMLVNNKVIVELKAAENLHPVNFRQLNSYLKASEIKLGLLINFHAEFLKKGIKRVVNGL